MQIQPQCPPHGWGSVSGRDDGDTAAAVRQASWKQRPGSFIWLWGPKGTDEQPAFLLLPGGRGMFFFIPTHLSLIKPRHHCLLLPRGMVFFFFCNSSLQKGHIFLIFTKCLVV